MSCGAESSICFVAVPLCRHAYSLTAECGCHKTLGSMRFRMFHLISLTSPVSRGAKRQLREPRHPVEQSWLTRCLPEGPALTLSHRHSLRACKTMRNQSADRYTKLQSLWMTTAHERSSGSPRSGTQYKQLCEQTEGSIRAISQSFLDHAAVVYLSVGVL